MPKVGNAFSLGELQVLSEPDQPFFAAAAIKLGPEERITSVVTGTEENYDMLNLPYVDAVSTLTAEVRRQGNKPFVWLQSKLPIHHESFYVLLKVSSNRHTYFPFFRVRSPAPQVEAPVHPEQTVQEESKRPEPATPARTDTVRSELLPLSTDHATPDPQAVAGSQTVKHEEAHVTQPSHVPVPSRSIPSSSIQPSFARPPAVQPPAVQPPAVQPPAVQPSQTARAPAQLASRRATQPVEVDLTTRPHPLPNSPRLRQPTRTASVRVRQPEAETARIYGPIRRGISLTAVARLFKKGASPSIFQIMAAIFARNPDHFIDHNMNGLKEGAMLIIPTPRESARVDNQEARKLRLEHAMAWKKTAPERAIASLRASDAVTPGGETSSLQSADAAPSMARSHPPSDPSHMSGTPDLEITSTARDEGPHTATLSPLPSAVTDQAAGEREAVPEQAALMDGANGNLQAILVQLQVITRVLEHSHGRQEQLEQRMLLLEQSQQEWNLLQERVKNLELLKDAAPYPLLSESEGEATLSTPVKEPWLIWGGVGVVSFAVLLGVFLLWLGRRWNRTDHWNNLRALLSATAQQEPDLLRTALKETEPAYEPFVPTLNTQKLDGIAPHVRRRTIVGNSEHVANKLKALIDGK